MAAHVDAQHAEPRGQQRWHLLGPHPAVRRQRVRHAHHRRARGANQVISDVSAFKLQPHGGVPPLYRVAPQTRTELVPTGNPADAAPLRGLGWRDTVRRR